ncbi:MAG: tetratricopeptide repeat protein [Devosia nanyangense]|uniref:Tetratricopeptide repeat protein n=1 Tax=Devosia nanyangense TaxID=1228055 RepID=A0A933L7S5_9HYPH|nr:tetratricopeptide repeat protein [Devosia nanyangense]
MENSKWNRLAGIVALVAALTIAAPALAIDTGGGDGGGGSSGGGGGHTQSAAPAVPTLATARADIKAKNWAQAITDLKLIVADGGGNADVYNLLGYSYRNAGSYELAGRAYVKALKLDPKHTGALEYQGVLFIKLGQLDKANANLAKIKTICGTGCEEYRDLAKALAT